MRRALLPVLLAAVAFSAAGCGAVGRVTSGDASAGKTLFAQDCGGCHTLADAKTQGTIGPNLDDAFSSDKSQGFSVQTMKDVVRGQIAYPELPMPAHIVQGAQADDVATYVAECSANANCGVTASTTATTTTTSSPTTTSAAGGTGTTTTSSPTTTSAAGGTTTSGGGSALAAGKAVFMSAGCASCHTLKDAGSTGTIGPNLDQLKPAQSIVAHQVTNGGGPMPAFKGRLTSAQINAVATYVSSVAGK